MKKILALMMCLLSFIPNGFCLIGDDLVWEVRPSTGQASFGGAFVASPTIPAPRTPVIGLSTGGTIVNGTYYVVQTYGNTDGIGKASSVASVIVSGSTNDAITFTSPPVLSTGDQSGYYNYVGISPGGPFYLQGSVNVIGVESSRTTNPIRSGTQPAGIDYSQQDAAQVSGSDLVVTSVASVVTSASYPFTSKDVGNVIRVVTSNAFAINYYEIKGVSVGNSAILDKAPAGINSTGGIYMLGGATNSLNSQPSKTACSVFTGGTNVFVKNQPGWNEVVSLGAAYEVSIMGYNANRFDNPKGTDRPNLNRASASGDAINTATGQQIYLKDIIISNAGSDGFYTSRVTPTGEILIASNVKFTGLGGYALNTPGSANSSQFYNCEIDNSAGAVISTLQGRTRFVYSAVHDNTASPIQSGPPDVFFSMFYDNAGDGILGTSIGASGTTILNSTIDGNTGATSDGITLGLTAPTDILGCIITNNGQYGINSGADSPWVHRNDLMNYNDVWGNVTNYYQRSASSQDVALDPQFTNAALDDYSIGTNLKAKGFGEFVSGGTGYIDIGAVQREEVSGGGGGGGHLVNI